MKYNMDLIYNHTENVIDIIIVELDDLKKNARNCSILGSKWQILINLPKVMFGY